MTVKKKIIFTLGGLLSFFLFASLFNSSVLGQTSTTEPVTATIKISVCGNGIAEGGEDCDNTDLGGAACVTLDYASGTLACDIACDFNTSGCSNTSEPTTSTSEQTTTSTPATATTPDTSIVTSIITSPITHIPPASSVSIIPPALNYFDLDNSGKIEIIEISSAVKSWVDEWREVLIEEIAVAKGEIFEKKEVKKCDVNNDDRCNLVDLSILLFYVQK